MQIKDLRKNTIARKYMVKLLPLTSEYGDNFSIKKLS